MTPKGEKTTRPERTPARVRSAPFALKRPALWAAGAYALLACALTFPLILRMNSSVYGFYDHISTDLFASIYYYFWWMREWLISHNHSFVNPLLNFPFGARMFLANATGFLMAPVGLLIGHLAAYNLVILANLILSGLGMFLLVRHLTKSAGAGFIAGIVYAFCPNMLVRSYTTFDSTQVQWIPFYTLYVIKFMENRTWVNALLAGGFLLCTILFAMPYYLVYLPVHTMILLLTYAVWKVRGEHVGIGVFMRGLLTPEALRGWLRIAAVFAVVVVAFGMYYKQIVGGGETIKVGRKDWNIVQLRNNSLKPFDYFIPHPRSALFKGNFKETYWDVQKRFEKNADSDVAYIGYVAILLAILGFWKCKGAAKWFFLAGAMVAFWATLGPDIRGLPTPSGLIYKYAPFARRILLYKVFVQFGMAGLAGMGTAFLLGRMKTPGKAAGMLAAVFVLMLGEYAIVPPFLSVDLTETPEVYARVKALPAKSALIEIPLKRAGGNLYQGYIFYQTVHGKPLFNPYVDIGLTKVPKRIQALYRQMETPLEAGQYANLAALRWLGITHLAYHIYIGTMTVKFLSFSAPDLEGGKVEGLRRIYECPRGFRESYRSPYDYTFADLHEITAEPCPVALVFDSSSPFEAAKGWQGQDGFLPYGFYSALFDTTFTFCYPLWNGTRTERVMRGEGRITAVNLSNAPVTFGVSFTARAADTRTLTVRWNGGAPLATFTAGPEPTACTVSDLSLTAEGTGVITVAASGFPYEYELLIGKESLKLPATASLADVRVVVKK